MFLGAGLEDACTGVVRVWHIIGEQVGWFLAFPVVDTPENVAGSKSRQGMEGTATFLAVGLILRVTPSDSLNIAIVNRGYKQEQHKAQLPAISERAGREHGEAKDGPAAQAVPEEELVGA